MENCLSAEETKLKLIEDSEVFIEDHLSLDDITWLTSKELLKITNEDPIDFLSRFVDEIIDVEKYADEVYANFFVNETYYFDKLIRKNRDDKRSN